MASSSSAAAATGSPATRPAQLKAAAPSTAKITSISATPPLPSELEEERKALNVFLDQHPNFAQRLGDFVTQLKRKDFLGTLLLARETLDLVLDLVKRQQWDSPVKLLLTLRGLGRRLILAQPLTLVVGSMIRRVLFLLREEMASAALKARERAERSERRKHRPVGSGDPVDDLDDTEGRATPDSSVPSLRGVMAELHDLDITELPAGHNWKGLKKTMMEAIIELRAELDNVNEPIAKQSVEFIHAREMVLVYGLSRAVEAFFLSAHENRLPHFEVFVAETPDGYKGHEMAQKLAARGIDATVITDSAIFGLMARVNKVVIAAHAVLANGGVLSDCGTNMVATAAKHYSVPVICVTGLYKLCPLYPFSQDTFNDLCSPGNVLDYADVGSLDVEIVSPMFDYVSPEKVALFVTDTGAHQPSYIYRLLAEYYSPLDKLTEGVPQLDL